MRFLNIKEKLRNSTGYKAIENASSEGKYPVGIYGISESSRAFLISSFFDEHDEDVYVFAHSDLSARQIYEDLLLYHINVFYLPYRETVFYNLDAVSSDLKLERLKVLKEMTSGEKKIIVSSINSLSSRYMPKKMYKDYSFTLRAADTINLDTLGKKLIEAGYERVELVENRGQFALRGGIIDIYSPIETFPVRIELFDDEIDTIRSFNPQTQRSIQNLKEVYVFPNTEIIIDKERLKRGRDLMLFEVDSLIKDKARRKAMGEEAVDKIKKIVSTNVETLNETWTFENIDSYLPYFFEDRETLFDYMENSYIFIDDTQRSLGKLESSEFEFNEQYQMFLKRGEILRRQNELLLPLSDIEVELSKRKTLTINDLKKTENFIKPKSLAQFSEFTIYNYHGQIEMLAEDIANRKKNGYSTIILSGTRARGERLVSILRDYSIESFYRDDLEDVKEGEVGITFGSSRKGFEFRDIKLAFVSDAEVFGESNTRHSKKRQKKGKGIEKIKSFDELRKGEYVVHVNQGIGIYQGIKQIESQGAVKDYLEIAYDGSDRLFIPVDQLDMIQKYIGNESSPPKVSKLSSKEWQKAKSKAKESVDKIAKEIVELYARRSKVKGFEYSPDSQMQRNFEEEFPYEETEDQLSSIAEIKKDMESPRVMDRLLCGDVGFGKTEVAMRAAFKAVVDNKQVAVLVPTTILAEQHYQNFKRRFEDFAVNIEMVSRFRTPKQVKEALKKLKEGNLDIIIGTHKLLGKDVIFKDLGLLIIDEEQRFGVKHKEKLKELKNQVDVLTLSATPIPRTLNMSMTGIRDISLIETPPENRFPIQTYVVEYNPQLIRDAILREKGRHGQVFFVYNRVEEIEKMTLSLEKLVPEASFLIAHGQLSERQLEDVMISFKEGEADVLVCSTIIETGLDIPNANTMIVYDSDKMGLSQLYQLRGRVGRSSTIAYSYLTYRKDKVLTEVAEKRLKALKDFTELGAGFKIAMKDLEIRGAGNMMGKAQHGQMASVGYDLYIRLLDEAVRKLMGKEEEYTQDTLVDIKIDAFISSSYIKDEVLKIQVYKKIAAIENLDDYMSVKGELEDRFSDIPDPVYNLMDIALLKARAKSIGVLEIREKGPDMSITFVNKDSILDGYIGLILDEYRDRIVVSKGDKPTFIFKYVSQDKDRKIRRISKFINELVEIKEIEDENLDKDKDKDKDKKIQNDNDKIEDN